DVAVFPPSLFVSQVEEALRGSRIAVGAQDCAILAEQGALTGEVAAMQLADAGCAFVLIGHSERRAILGESDEWLVKKFAAAQAAGLVPVLCVGESLAQREAGQTLKVVGQQLD